VFWHRQRAGLPRRAPTTATAINTDDPTACAATAGDCVIAATDLVISQVLQATGTAADLARDRLAHADRHRRVRGRRDPEDPEPLGDVDRDASRSSGRMMQALG
jgi:hypothetical protein